MKRKESNYRRYITLCDEDIPQTHHSYSNKFGPEYITQRHLGLEHDNTRFDAYLTINTDTDNYELFIIFDGFRLRRTSLVEGNLDRWLNEPQLIISVALDVIKRRNMSWEHRALQIVE